MSPGTFPPATPPVRPRTVRPADAGFTVIEVLVASTLLIISVLATLALLDNGARATSTSLQRDTGNAIAREVVERAQGMTYTTLRNDLTDVQAAAPRTPAERLRAAMDPNPAADGSSSSAPMIDGTATPIASATDPWRTTASWNLRRRGTDYRVTYRSCTRSEPVSGVLTMGPYDCDRAPSTTPPPGPIRTVGTCALTLTNQLEVQQQLSVDPKGVVVRVQLLNLLGVRACVSGTLAALGLGDLAKSLCAVLGDGTNALSTVTGLLNSVLGPLASSVSLAVCPSPEGDPPPEPLVGGIATSTELQTTVSWTEKGSGRPARIVQTAVVRKGA